MFLLFVSAEALGAIGIEDVTDTLKQFVKDPTVSVAETCQLALRRIAWLADCKDKYDKNNPYFSVDPTPADAEESLQRLRERLLDNSLDLFERYKSLFALRNMKTSEAALVLTEGMSIYS
jgi:deoxyhypusine monooxygenase